MTLKNTQLQDNDLQRFVEHSNKINGRVLSFTRFLMLTLLAYFQEGIQYRELRVALKISDGKLVSNLRYLTKMGYVRKFLVNYDNKKLDVYALTEEGKKELELVTEWLALAAKVAKGG